MKVFYVARHGKTEYNEQKRLQGWIDTPLTEKGIANARNITAKVKGKNITAVYSSDLGRAFRTAYLVTQEVGVFSEIRVVKDLREVSFGEYAGMLIDEAEQKYPDLQKVTGYVPLGGESLAAMQTRVLNFLYTVEDSEAVLLVTHDSVINAIYAAYAKIDLGTYNVEHYNENDFVAKVVIDNGRIIEFSEVS